MRQVQIVQFVPMEGCKVMVEADAMAVHAPFLLLVVLGGPPAKSHSGRQEPCAFWFSLQVACVSNCLSGSVGNCRFVRLALVTFGRARDVAPGQVRGTLGSLWLARLFDIASLLSPCGPSGLSGWRRLSLLPSSSRHDAGATFPRSDDEPLRSHSVR